MFNLANKNYLKLIEFRQELHRFKNINLITYQTLDTNFKYFQKSISDERLLVDS